MTAPHVERKMRGKVTVLALVVLSYGCTLSDDERCKGGGFTWDAKQKSCRLVATDSATGSSETEPSSDGATQSASATHSSETTVPVKHGLGKACSDESGCAEFAESYCAINPLTKEGYCTTSPCENGGCASGYKCCDCTKATLLPQITGCLTNADATSAVSMAGCTCEGA